jgi:signal transduction histidine kinase
MIGGALLKDGKITTTDKDFKTMMKDLSIPDLIVVLNKQKDKEGYIQLNDITLKYFKISKEETFLMLHALDDRSRNLLELGDLTAAMSHDFNNIINVGIVSLEMMKYSLENLSDKPEVIETFDQIEGLERALDHATSIVDGSKMLAKADTKKQSINLIKLLHSLVSIKKSSLKLKDISLTFKTTMEDAQIEGVDGKLMQVFFNLLKNSEDALDDVSKLKKWIEIRIAEVDDNYEITFIDGGPGIPAEIAKKIFEPYFTTKNNEGTGIGLHSCHKIIDVMHQGKLEYIPSANTAFKITLKKGNK